MSELEQATIEDQSKDALLAKYPEAADGLRSYAHMLRTRGIEWGLLGPREVDKVWSRHISNSLAVVGLVSEGLEIADVGSGAGLPGIPVALARPDLRITLLEPLLRRFNFLNLAVEELGLDDRVAVERLRAEDCDQVYDVVTGRAVASLDKLLKWTMPLFYPEGQLLALKGASAEEEIRAAATVLQRAGLSAEVLEIRAAPGLEGTRAVRVRATG